MDLIPSLVNAVVVVAVGLILGWMFKGRFDALDRRMDRHGAQDEARFGRHEDRFAQIDSRFEDRFAQIASRFEDRFAQIASRFEDRFAQIDSRFDSLQASIDSLRSDLTQLAIALGTRPKAENA